MVVINVLVVDKYRVCLRFSILGMCLVFLIRVAMISESRLPILQIRLSAEPLVSCGHDASGLGHNPPCEPGILSATRVGIGRYSPLQFVQFNVHI